MGVGRLGRAVLVVQALGLLRRLWDTPTPHPAPSLRPAAQGHVYRSTTGKFEQWFNPNWIDLNHIPSTPVDLPLLKVRGWRAKHWAGEGRGVRQVHWASVVEAGRRSPGCVGRGGGHKAVRSSAEHKAAVSKQSAPEHARAAGASQPARPAHSPSINLPAANLHRCCGEAAHVRCPAGHPAVWRAGLLPGGQRGCQVRVRRGWVGGWLAG